MTTDISICNSSLIMVGADEITSFDDNTFEAKLASSVYEDTKQSLLQYYPWRFSLKQKDLGGALVASPEFNWKYKYQLPSDCLRVISMEKSKDYEVFGYQIYTNETECKVIYQRNVLESEFPSYFVASLRYHLAKLFSMSLQEDPNKWQIFDRACDKETARARQIDAQQQPNKNIPDVAYRTLSVRG